jgi:hypothetical protein
VCAADAELTGWPAQDIGVRERDCGKHHVGERDCGKHHVGERDW